MIFFLEIINFQNTLLVTSDLLPSPQKGCYTKSNNNKLKQVYRKRDFFFICLHNRQTQVEVMTLCGSSYNIIRSSFSLFPIYYYSCWLYSPFIVKRWLEKLQSQRNLLKKSCFQQVLANLIWWSYVSDSPWTNHCGGYSYISRRIHADEETRIIAP